MSNKFKFFFDPETLRENLSATPKELFMFCYNNCDWEDATDLADIYSDFVAQVEFYNNEL